MIPLVAYKVKTLNVILHTDGISINSTQRYTIQSQGWSCKEFRFLFFCVEFEKVGSQPGLYYEEVVDNGVRREHGGW